MVLLIPPAEADDLTYTQRLALKVGENTQAFQRMDEARALPEDTAGQGGYKALWLFGASLNAGFAGVGQALTNPGLVEDPLGYEGSNLQTAIYVGQRDGALSGVGYYIAAQVALPGQVSLNLAEGVVDTRLERPRPSQARHSTCVRSSPLARACQVCPLPLRKP